MKNRYLTISQDLSEKRQSMKNMKIDSGYPVNLRLRRRFVLFIQGRTRPRMTINLQMNMPALSAQRIVQ